MTAPDLGEYEPGDLISYRAVWADVDPHLARVDHVVDRGLVVLDEPSPAGSGMPLTHLVTWDRVIGRSPAPPDPDGGSE